ncbi:MAG TPA: VTT domain-containing protein [Candidatus Binatia bacterium]|nr:VTT domain-containing protein [Candidatus Binatia bacterium]
MQKYSQLIYVKLNSMTEKQRRVLDVTITLLLTGALIWGLWSFLQGEAVFNLFANDASKFRDYLVNLGGWASFTYVWLVMLEVLIAFIPGWFVYPVGAAIFGFLQTVMLVMLANFLGASISFWIGRRWGKPLIEKFIATSSINKFDSYMERNGTWAIFILKINPITSFDIWNYIAGASRISYWKFSIANLLGILPLVVFSAALGEQGFEVAPQLLGILLLLTILYIVWYFVNLPHKISKFRNKNSADK